MERDESKAKIWGKRMERSSWLLIFLSMMTQVSTLYAFPSYNIIMGFWGVYCVYTRDIQATITCILFTLFSIILDIVFCSINGNDTDSSVFQFALVMLVFCLLDKVYMLFTALHFFTALGGEHNLPKRQDAYGDEGVAGGSWER